LALLFSSAILVSGCDSVNGPSHSIAGGKEIHSLSNKADSTAPSTIKELYAAYVLEKTMCRRIIDAIHSDADFATHLENELIQINLGKMQYPELRRLLAQSPIVKLEPIQYLVDHFDYFTVRHDFHAHYYDVFREGHPIVCTQRVTRLLAMEALGPSPESWNARRDFMDLYLGDLDLPWYGLQMGTSFENFSSFVDGARTLYNSPNYQRDFSDWLARAVAHIQQAFEQYPEDGTDIQMDSKERDQIRDGWILKLIGTRREPPSV
jgi:hypothetical protein